MRKYSKREEWALIRRLRGGATPASIGGLQFDLSAKVGATSLDGTTGTWLERVTGFAIPEVAGGSPPDSPVYSATGWDGTLPSVDWDDGAAHGYLRDNTTLSAPAILPNPCTVAVVLDNTNTGNELLICSEDGSARIIIDNSQLFVRYANTQSANLNVGDVSGKHLMFFTVNGTAANVFIDGVAGTGNPGVVVATPPAAGGVAIGAHWGGSLDSLFELAALNTWNKVLVAAQMNDLANDWYRPGWNHAFGGTWAL